jgi:hypothetical protein
MKSNAGASLMRFDTREHFERVKSVVAEANEQNLDRLAAELGRSRKP